MEIEKVNHDLVRRAKKYNQIRNHPQLKQIADIIDDSLGEKKEIREIAKLLRNGKND